MQLNEILHDFTQVPLKDIKQGDFVTTAGIGPCSGGDGYGIVEKVIAISADGEILVDGWDGFFSSTTFQHNHMMYRLCRAFCPKAQPE